MKPMQKLAGKAKDRQAKDCIQLDTIIEIKNMKTNSGIPLRSELPTLQQEEGRKAWASLQALQL
jgi:hypothetical protein